MIKKTYCEYCDHVVTGVSKTHPGPSWWKCRATEKTTDQSSFQKDYSNSKTMNYCRNTNTKGKCWRYQSKEHSVEFGMINKIIRWWKGIE